MMLCMSYCNSRTQLRFFLVCCSLRLTQVTARIWPTVAQSSCVFQAKSAETLIWRNVMMNGPRAMINFVRTRSHSAVVAQSQTQIVLLSVD